MRYENADAHEKKKPCCNIQHRTGSKARPYDGNMHSSVCRRLAATFRPCAGGAFVWSGRPDGAHATSAKQQQITNENLLCSFVNTFPPLSGAV
jgi:hypothetical protein